jgi:hypothetical protein
VAATLVSGFNQDAVVNMSHDIQLLPCGLTVEAVRKLLGTPDPVPRELDKYVYKEEPYIALLGDQKTRNKQIQYDMPLTLFLGLMDLPHERIGAAFGVSRQCIRKQLVAIGFSAKDRMKFDEYRRLGIETYYE